MTEKAKSTAGQPKLEIPKGSMFLYEQPELMSHDEHSSLGFVTPPNPYEFANKISTVPLLASEISSAQKHYPVIFSAPANAIPYAVVSILKDENMFVNSKGQWEELHYVPSYLRRHPFALASGSEDQLAMVIDRSSNTITENSEHPFFENGVLSERAQQMVDYCGYYEAERRRTMEFTSKLRDLGLLVLQEVKSDDKAEGKTENSLASYFVVDVNKLNELTPDELQDLHKQGYISFIFAHLFSLENWQRLIDRRQLMVSAAEAAAQS
jgi:hypothetical protein